MNKILNTPLENVTLWKERNKKSGNFNKLIKRIRNFMVQISGNDLISMLLDILNKGDKEILFQKFIKALKGISVFANKSNQKNQHHFIRPLRKAGMSLNDIRKIGFNCSKNLWRSCLNERDRHLGGAKLVPYNLIIELHEHMKSISEISAYRPYVARQYNRRIPTIVYKKRTISKTIKYVRHRQTTFRDAFMQYKTINFNKAYNPENKKMKFNSFYKYARYHYRKPFRPTDLCHYCEMGKQIIREIKKEVEINRYDFKQEYKAENLFNYFNQMLNRINNDSSLKIRGILDKINDLKSIEFHKEIARRQREIYNKTREKPSYLKGNILIELDYKSKIRLGVGPRQLNKEYFLSTKKVSCLGFGVYYVNKITNQINCLEIDLISDYEGSTAQDVIKNFKYIMNLPEFKEIAKGINEFIIWADCGTQLRCAEFNYFLFDELALQGISISMNWFAPKHGKNMRDQHFSVISKKLNYAKFKLKTSFKEAQEVVDYLNSTFNQTTQTSKAYLYNLPQKETIDIGRREIKDLNCYFNLQNIKTNDGSFEFSSSIYSDLTELLPVNCKVGINPKQRINRTIDIELNKVRETTNEQRRAIINDNLTLKKNRTEILIAESNIKSHKT